MMPAQRSPFAHLLTIYDQWASRSYISNRERLACRKQLTWFGPQSDRSGYWLRMAFEAIDELGLSMHDFHICLDEFLGLSRLAPLSHEDINELAYQYDRSRRGQAYHCYGSVDLTEWVSNLAPTAAEPLNLGSVILLQAVARHASFHCPQVNQMLALIYSESRTESSILYQISSLQRSDAVSADYLKRSTLSPDSVCQPGVGLSLVLDSSAASNAMDRLFRQVDVTPNWLGQFLAASDSILEDELDNAVTLMVGQLTFDDWKLPELYTFFDGLTAKRMKSASPMLHRLYSEQLIRLNYYLENQNPIDNPIDAQEYSEIAWRHAVVTEFGLLNEGLVRAWMVDLCRVVGLPNYVDEVSLAIRRVLDTTKFKLDRFLDALLPEFVPSEQLPRFLKVVHFMTSVGAYPITAHAVGMLASRERAHDDVVVLLNHALDVNSKCGLPLNSDTQASVYYALGHHYRLSSHPQGRGLARQHLLIARSMGLLGPMAGFYELYLSEDDLNGAARVIRSMDFLILLDEQQQQRHRTEQFLNLHVVKRGMIKKLKMREGGAEAIALQAKPLFIRLDGLVGVNELF